MKLIRNSVAATLLTVIAGLVLSAPAEAVVRSCSSSTPVASRPTLRYGDTGSCVKVAQQLLINKGYSLGGYGATGNFLSYTKAAVLAFQKKSALSQNGTVDQPTWKKLMASSAPAYNIYKGPNYTSRVILTYDDCPKSLTAMKTMVRHAKAIGVGMVLAPTGNCIKAGRFDAAYARIYGQYVINHTVTHPDLRTLTYTQMLPQLGSPGPVTNYGRPPFGAYNPTVQKAYAAKGMRMWLWNVDTRDWTGKTSSQVINYIVTYSYAGSTDLMHMQWNGFTPTALSAMKNGLATKRGLGVCRPYTGTTPVRLPDKLPC